MPTPKTFHRLAIVAAVLLALIVVSGAAVRLTGSGLGCPTWPRCTNTSLVAPASYHGWIEFGNRILTTLVGIFVVIVAIASFARQPHRRDLVVIACAQIAGFVGQAVIGGLSVLYDLAPPFVIAHFLLSMAMLWAALLLVHRADPHRVGPQWQPTPPSARRELTWLLRLVSMTAGAVLVLGTITTGAGPHAGDGGAHIRRLALPLERVTQLHADAALLLTGLVIATLFAVRLTDTTEVVRRRAVWLAGAIGVQVVIGYTQYFLNLPPGVVELHVAGATVLWCAAVWLQLGLTAPPRTPVAVPATRTARPQPLRTAATDT